MIDIEKRKKWNYNDSSSKQFEKYVNKMNTVHNTPTEQYLGQFPLSGLVSPRNPQEANIMLKQQQMYQSYGYSMLPQGMSVPMQQYNPSMGYVVPQVPQTPMGFLGIDQYYKRRYK